MSARVALCLFLLLGACSTTIPGNLLDKKTPQSVSGVDHPERLTDGRVPVEGDHWQTNLTSVWQLNANAVFDLGSSTPINTIVVVGDNNDDFDFAASDDGQSWKPLWSSGRIAGPGMRLREGDNLGGKARYVRLTVRGGDPNVSIGEVLVFAARSVTDLDVALERARGDRPGTDAERIVYAFGSVSVGFLLLLLVDKLPRPVMVALGAIALLTSGWCASQLYGAFPLPWDVISLLRAMIAVVAAVALLCWTLASRYRVGPIQVALSLLAIVSVACFFNLGTPWFKNAAQNRPTVVHLFDMRVYFPVAKYFNELRFDGVYLASVAAYSEAEQIPLSKLGYVELRDLTTNQVVRVRDVMPAIEHIKGRFSDARWHDFKKDMRFFWKTMGPSDYLGSLRDHGGNATPVWLATTQLLFAGYEANEHNLVLTGLLDPVLLIVLFVCIGRSFGLRAMLACAIVFGATDLPMFGSNWWGSTLRMDWMVCLGLAACALKTQRFVVAGAFLAYAGLVRAFPMIALLFTLVPLGVYIVERVLEGPRPAFSELRAQSASLSKVLLGAAVTSVLLVGLSGALLGFEAGWGGWFEKIALHTDKANLNHVGLRTILSFDPHFTADKVWQLGGTEPWARWEVLQRQTLEHRAALLWALRGFFVLLCVLACRGATLERAALLGLILIPVLFYPANYYCHYVFLLPLLAVGLQPMAAMVLEGSLLGMCALQYLTLFGPGDIRFYWSSVLLIGCLFLLLLPLAYHALRDRLTWFADGSQREQEMPLTAAAPNSSFRDSLGDATHAR